MKKKQNKTPVTIIGTGTVNDMCPYGEQKLLFFGEFSGVDMLQMWNCTEKKHTENNNSWLTLLQGQTSEIQFTLCKEMLM